MNVRIPGALCASLLSLSRTLADTGFEQLPFVPVTAHEAATYNGAGQSADYGARVVASPSGRVYVMGQSTDVAVQNYLFMRCYGADGALIWKDDRALNGFVATDLVVDSQDNAYAVGMVYNDGGFASSQDAGIFKYDSAGVPAREEIMKLDYLEPLSGTTFNQNRPTAAALTPAGMLIVSGYVSRGVFAQPRDEAHPVMFAVDTAGPMSLVWTSATHPEAALSTFTQEVPVSLAVNAASEIYELSNYGRNGNGVTLRKVSASGASLWKDSATIQSFGTTRHNAVQVGLDSAGNPYVVGNVDEPDGRKIYIAKFAAADGAVTWVKTYAFGSATEVEAARVLNDGSVIGAGSGGFGDWLVFEANSDGHLQWSQPYSSGSAKNLTLDAAGNIYVLGESLSFDEDPELFASGNEAVAKFSSHGQFVWGASLTDAHGLTPEPDSELPRRSGLAVTQSGTVYVTGHRNFEFSKPVEGRAYPNYDAVLFQISPPSAEPPAVRFVTPAEGQIVSAAGPFPKVSVEASSASGIQKVILYNGRHQILGVLTNPPYDFTVNASELISVVPLYAVAYDRLGYASYARVAVAWSAPEYTIEFAQPEFRVSEKEGPLLAGNELQEAQVKIAARRSNVSGSAQVQVTMTPGSATALDFQNAFGTQEPFTLFFEDGSSIAEESIIIRKDNFAEPEESFTLALSDPSAGTLGALQTATVKIVDDDSGQASPSGVIQVNPVDYLVSEGERAVDITVTRSAASDAASIDYYTQPNTAQEGIDYLGALGTLHFAPGETSRTLRVYILSDTAAETQETFYVTFHQPGNGATLGASYFAYVRIQDSPAEPPPATGISQWTASAFSEAELANPQISGGLADPDNDGYPNLVEYALGLNPKQSSPKNLLNPTVRMINGQPALEVNFTRPKGRNDLDYLFSSLEKIGSTPCATCADVRVTDNGNGTESVRVLIAGSPQNAKSAFLLFRIAQK